METIATTDSDYATAGKLKTVVFPADGWLACTMEGKVGAGTFTAVDVFKTVALNDAGSVAVDTACLDLIITGYISSTRGEFAIIPHVTQTA